MPLTDYKITDGDINAKGVVAAPDKLEGTPAENKAVFDRLIREAIKASYNSLIDALEDLGVEQAVILAEDAGMKYIRLNEDGALETSEDGVAWEAAGAGGHVILDSDGVLVPQRSRMKFAEGTVEDVDGVTVVHGVQGPPGPGVPPVTSTDNGKYLGVDDGAVAALSPDSTPTADSGALITSGAVAAALAALAGTAKIETGTYTGTGTYGSSNKCSLTFGFTPKLVIINNANPYSYKGEGFLPWISGQTNVPSFWGVNSGSLYMDTCTCAWDDNKIQWHNSTGAERQLNRNNQTYYYVAIG